MFEEYDVCNGWSREIPNWERVGSAPTIADVILSELRLCKKAVLTIAIGAYRGEAQLLKEIDELGSRGGECLILCSEASVIRGTVKRFAIRAQAMKKHYGRDVLSVMLVADPPGQDTFFHVKTGIFISNDYPTARVLTTSANWSETGTGSMLMENPDREKLRITDENISVYGIPFNHPETADLLRPFEEYYDSIIQAKRVIIPRSLEVLRPTEESAKHLLKLSAEFRELPVEMQNQLKEWGVTRSQWREVALGGKFKVDDQMTTRLLNLWHDSIKSTTDSDREKDAFIGLTKSRKDTGSVEGRKSITTSIAAALAVHTPGSENLTPASAKISYLVKMEEADFHAYYRAIGIGEVPILVFMPCCSSVSRSRKITLDSSQNKITYIKHNKAEVSCFVIPTTRVKLGIETWPLTTETRIRKSDGNLESLEEQIAR